MSKIKAFKLKDTEELHKMFYGTTFGMGFDHYSSSNIYWTLGLLVPIRGDEVHDYIDNLKTRHGVGFKQDLLPIGISIGIRFILA